MAKMKLPHIHIHIHIHSNIWVCLNLVRAFLFIERRTIALLCSSAICLPHRGAQNLRYAKASIYLYSGCLCFITSWLLLLFCRFCPTGGEGKQLAAIMANARTICTLCGVGISTSEFQFPALSFARCTATMRQRKYLSATQSTSCFCFANTRSDEAPSTTLSSWICNASTCRWTHWMQFYAGILGIWERSRHLENQYLYLKPTKMIIT